MTQVALSIATLNPRSLDYLTVCLVLIVGVQRGWQMSLDIIYIELNRFAKKYGVHAHLICRSSLHKRSSFELLPIILGITLSTMIL